jgi:ribose transport system permease protein
MSSRFWSAIQNFGPLLALLVLITVAALIDHDGKFLTVRNFENILRQNSVVGIVALGMTFVIILGGIDLSVGSLTALLGGVGIVAMNKAAASGWSPAGSIAIAAAVMVLGGPLLGTLSGAIISYGRITPFITTLGGMAIFRSLALAIKDGGEYRSDVELFSQVAEPKFLGEWASRFPAMVFFSIAAVLAIILKCTRYGTAVHAVGDNDRAALYAGIKLPRITIATYALSGLMCGIGALLASSRMNSISSAQTGSMYELDAIAAVVVGGASMRGGYGRISGTIVGVLILGVVSNMLNMISSSDSLKALGLENVNMIHLQGCVKGVIIIAAVLVQRRR